LLSDGAAWCQQLGNGGFACATGCKG